MLKGEVVIVSASDNEECLKALIDELDALNCPDRMTHYSVQDEFRRREKESENYPRFFDYDHSAHVEMLIDECITSVNNLLRIEGLRSFGLIREVNGVKSYGYYDIDAEVEAVV